MRHFKNGGLAYLLYFVIPGEWVTVLFSHLPLNRNLSPREGRDGLGALCPEEEGKLGDNGGWWAG